MLFTGQKELVYIVVIALPLSVSFHPLLLDFFLSIRQILWRGEQLYCHLAAEHEPTKAAEEQAGALLWTASQQPQAPALCTMPSW